MDDLAVGKADLDAPVVSADLLRFLNGVAHQAESAVTDRMHMEIDLLLVQSDQNIPHLFHRRIGLAAVRSGRIIVERLCAEAVSHFVGAVDKELDRIAPDVIRSVFLLPPPHCGNGIFQIFDLPQDRTCFVVHAELSGLVKIVDVLEVLISFRESVHHTHDAVLAEEIKQRLRHLVVHHGFRSPADRIEDPVVSLDDAFQAPACVVAVFILLELRLSDRAFAVGFAVFSLEHLKGNRVVPAGVIAEILDACRPVADDLVKQFFIWAFRSEGLCEIAFVVEIRFRFLRVLLSVLPDIRQQLLLIQRERSSDEPVGLRNRRWMGVSVQESRQEELPAHVHDLRAFRCKIHRACVIPYIGEISAVDDDRLRPGHFGVFRVKMPIDQYLSHKNSPLSNRYLNLYQILFFIFSVPWSMDRADSRIPCRLHPCFFH